MKLFIFVMLLSTLAIAEETEKPQPEVVADDTSESRVKMEEIEIDLSGRSPASSRGGMNLR